MKYALLVAIGLLASGITASAESRIYIIANQPGEYGVDQCLSTGARCGALIADTFCQSNNYAKARAFRVADAAEVTSAVTPASASGPAQLIAIECER